jgi:hypothetical protein
MSPAKARAWQHTAGRFLFKHRRSGHHLHQISLLYLRIIDAVRTSIKVTQPDEIVHSGYSGPLLDELYYNLDSFFEAMRSTHDASLSCLSSAGLLRDAPHSLHDFYKKHEKQSNSSTMNSSPIHEILVTFWKVTGSATKDYRDCLAHYVSLSGPTWQHSANAVWRQNSWTLSLYLPDNPQARSYNTLTFVARVDALTLCKKLHQETEQLARAILIQSAEHWQVGPIDTSTIQMTVSNVVIGD